MYLFIPQRALSEHVFIFAWVAHKLSFKEGHVEAGGIVVNKLEEEHLDGQFVFILDMCFWNFCREQAQDNRVTNVTASVLAYICIEK